jgi:hypothetical protein
VAASQAPEFAQQYRQRLGGAIDELARIIDRFDADARANGESRESAIARLRGNGDDLASRQGAAMVGNLDRLTRLEGHRRSMAEAGPFARVALIARDGDSGVLRSAYRDFEPAMPVTEEGAIAAAAGFGAAWGAVLLLAGFVGSLFRRRPVSARRG